MLPDSNSLLDKVIQILRDIRSQTLGLQHTQNLVACDEAHLGDTMAISKKDTWGRKGFHKHTNNTW